MRMTEGDIPVGEFVYSQVWSMSCFMNETQTVPTKRGDERRLYKQNVVMVAHEESDIPVGELVYSQVWSMSCLMNETQTVTTKSGNERSLSTSNG